MDVVHRPGQPPMTRDEDLSRWTTTNCRPPRRPGRPAEPADLQIRPPRAAPSRPDRSAHDRCQTGRPLRPPGPATVVRWGSAICLIVINALPKVTVSRFGGEGEAPESEWAVRAICGSDYRPSISRRACSTSSSPAANASNVRSRGSGEGEAEGAGDEGETDGADAGSTGGPAVRPSLRIRSSNRARAVG